MERGMSKFFEKFLRPTLLDKVQDEVEVKKLTRWDVLNSLYLKNVIVTDDLLKLTGVSSYDLINYVSNDKNYVNEANMAQVQLYGAPPLYVYKFLDALIKKQKAPFFKVAKTKLTGKEYEDLINNLCLLYKSSARSVKMWLSYNLVDDETISTASSKTFLGGKQ